MSFGLLSIPRRVSMRSSTQTGEFIPGETIIKLYYWKRIGGYVTIPGDSLFRVAGDGYTLKPVD
jgi:hypothetical protein